MSPRLPPSWPRTRRARPSYQAYTTGPYADASHGNANHGGSVNSVNASYGNSPYPTDQFRAGDVADRTWGDPTMRLQPVRPHDSQDPRNPR